MSQHDIRSAERPEPDQVLVDIADYVCNADIDSKLAYETAHYCLLDTLACGFQALDYPACTKLLGPVVPGATLPGGARVPGTSYELEPVMVTMRFAASQTMIARAIAVMSWATGGLWRRQFRGLRPEKRSTKPGEAVSAACGN